MIDTSTVGIVLMAKSSALETSRQELSEDESVGTGTFLVIEKSSLENRPRELWYTPSYTGRVPGTYTR